MTRSMPSTSKHTLDDDDDDDCPICLHPCLEVAVVPTCSHRFCFDCINIWTEQSRRCPLCNQEMSDYLLRGPAKKRHFLSRAPGLLPLHRLAPRTRNARHLRMNRPWGPRNEAVSEEDRANFSIEKRRKVYAEGRYATRVVSTISRPYASPNLFAELPELVARTSAFVNRELRVWPHLDAEWLTTYIISFMKSIDIRSERSIESLAGFLDDNGDTRIARHFAHEVYMYVCSPFQNLSMYDMAVRYDRPRKT